MQPSSATPNPLPTQQVASQPNRAHHTVYDSAKHHKTTARRGRFSRVLLVGLLCHAGGVVAAELTEKDYFSDIPEILTVTRLAQPLSETPGAVTVIDRATIRRSGARDVADLLRLVPGYIVSGWNGANPVGIYHAAISDSGSQNQVLIDGRSVYSSFYLGDTHRGMMGVVLEDIERIEVLRGSNSAAYGANAFLGVINIVTSHAADTTGTVVSAAAGGEGVRDTLLRHGWGSPEAFFRLTAASQSDHGYRNAHDDKTFSQIQFRGDLKPALDTDLMLTAGALRHSAGEGFSTSAGNPLRTVLWDSFFLNGSWQKSLSPDELLKISASYEQESIYDQSYYQAIPGLLLDFGGRGQRLSAELQHTVGLGAGLRANWGFGVKREAALSPPLYFSDKVSFERYQLFSNVEWKPRERWIINAGGLWEKHSDAGTEFAPRLAVNYRLAPGHTLRAGLTRSFRSPSLFELKADTRYFLGGVQIGRTYVARGEARAESVESRELGYLGELPALRLTLDVRAFEERIKNLIRLQDYTLLPSLAVTGTAAKDYINYPGYYLRGIEYQARWKPNTDTEIWLNQAFLTTLNSVRDQDSAATPRHITTLAWFQRIGALELTAQLYNVDSMSFRNPASDRTAPRTQLDLRLAWPFRLGATRAEVAVISQAANGGYPVFMPSRQFEFARRTFGTLRLEF